jgi:hypothetical protein
MSAQSPKTVAELLVYRVSAGQGASIGIAVKAGLRLAVIGSRLALLFFRTGLPGGGINQEIGGIMDAVTDQGHLQRRSALRAAAAAGLAVPLAYAAQAGGLGATAPGSPAQAGPAQPAEPVIAHVRNARTGEIDIFQGSTQVRVHDVALAAQLARAAR